MKFKFPLGQNVHDAGDVLNMISTLLTENFTMGKQVQDFEEQFAEYIGAKHAVMVNSGSSANLLALATLTNYKRQSKLSPGDEVLVPAVCWSTSVFPIIQSNLTPVFVDVDPDTLNIDINDLVKKITDKTKAIMLVHVLGNCTDMDWLLSIVEYYNLILIEDTCESLGSLYKNKYLGSFGTLGTFSFYYSHHLTTIEGGMIVCNDEEDYDILKCLRAHGWSRSSKYKEDINIKYPDLDLRFTFMNLGYNVRPMEIQATMGINQLKGLNNKNKNRQNNYNKIRSILISDPRNDLLTFPKNLDNTDIAWFGVTMFLNNKINIGNYLEYLTKCGVENRPIITGNITRQPVIKDLYNIEPTNYPGAEYCHFRGFFIGLSCLPMHDDEVKELTDILLSYQ